MSFREKPQMSSQEGIISGGFFVCNRKVFDYLSFDDDCDFEHGPLEDIAAKGELMVYKHEGFWYCMDTLRDMDALNKMWNQNQAPWKVW